MSVAIKSGREIDLMQEAGNILAIVHDELQTFISPGISALDIDKKAEEIIRSYGCVPSFLHYSGYPASICVSINQVVVHGIPTRNMIIQDGDIVSIDAGVEYRGYHSDSARTWAVGQVSDLGKRLIQAAEDSFYEGIRFAKEGFHINDISTAIQKYVEEQGFSVVRDLVGHGIGAKLHENPQIPNYNTGKRGVKLQKGMTLAIEPMINAGDYRVKTLPDKWTVVTADGSLSAHYENTILITNTEPVLLSVRK